MSATLHSQTAQLFSKNCCRSDTLFATLCLIRIARDLNFRPLAPETKGKRDTARPTNWSTKLKFKFILCFFSFCGPQLLVVRVELIKFKNYCFLALFLNLPWSLLQATLLNSMHLNGGKLTNGVNKGRCSKLLRSTITRPFFNYEHVAPSIN